ncbi:MAG: acetate/propionate family kinase [Pseudomonadota bacterium]
MAPPTELILTLNAGSSSIKFAAFPADPAEGRAAFRGAFDGIGVKPGFKVQDGEGALIDAFIWDRPDALGGHAGALSHLMAWLERFEGAGTVRAVGHRIVHGGTAYAEPVALTPDVLDGLRALEPLAPLHQPYNLAGIEAALAAFPEAVQVGCFDTAFHRAHPWVNDTFALPRRFYEAGVRRYGFHGLSYEFIVSHLRAAAPAAASGRLIACHLGNGASMCAIKAGQSIGSTMGFSALDGLPMGTRCGQIDPGVLLYLMGQQGLSVDEVQTLLYRESGLKGLSGLTSDMRDLETSKDPKAAEAIDYFVFRIKRELGAMAAVLGGVDAIAFAGGIGENSSLIRERVCADFGWLGVTLDTAANQSGAAVISRSGAPVTVHVVKTNEEAVIARHCRALLANRL